jgi:hypothetical protein
VLVAQPPFQPADTEQLSLRDHLAALLDRGVRVDPTHKQIARDRAVWRIRVRRADGTVVDGVAEAAFTGNRLASLRLGPA